MTTRPCALCGDPWLEVVHFCPPTPSLDDATARPGPEARSKVTTRTITFRCRCGGPVLFANSSWPTCEKCRLACHVCSCPEMPQDAHSAKSEALTDPDGSPCHCARLLPALRRWAVARDAYYRRGESQTAYEFNERIGEHDAAGAALEALAWELTGG